MGNSYEEKGIKMNNKHSVYRNENRFSFWGVFVKGLGVLAVVAIAYAVIYLSFRDGTAYSQDVISDRFEPVAVLPSENNTSASSDSGSDIKGSENSVDLSQSEFDFSKMPTGTEEIVNYYNAVNSKAKSQSTSVIHTYNNVTNYNGVIETGDNALLAKIAKAVMGSFLKEDTTQTVYSSREEITRELPPSDASCRLSAEDVESAVCSDKGSYYEIEIHIKPETDPVSSKATGAVCSIITKDEILDAVEGYVDISNIHCNYENVYIIAHVDKSTGNMTYLYTYMPMYLDLTALGMDCRVGLTFEDKYTINW